MRLYQLTLFFVLCSVVSVIDCKEMKQKIEKLIVDDKPKALQKLVVKALDRSLTLQEIEDIAYAHQYKPLINATIATRKVFSRYKNLGISRRNFFKTALFITTKLSPSLKKKRYLTPHLTGLKDTIEYDPKTKKTFILLERYKDGFLGKGKRKTVCKAILFHPSNPKVLARAEQSSPMDNEIRMLKRMRDAPGVVKTHAFTSHTRRKKTMNTVYFNLYKTGAIKKSFENKFNLKEAASIIYDILTGLESFHKQNLVHRDLHSGNFLMAIAKKNPHKKPIDTVIADFGRTMDVKKARAVPVQGSCLYRAPEGIDERHMKGKDYFASDIYAVGCISYQIFHRKQPSWQGYYLRNDSFSLKEQRKLLIKKLKKANDERRKRLLHYKAGKGLNPKQKLELLILKMLEVNPEKRGTATQLRAKAKSILDAVNMEAVGLES